jgi:peroxiredoxin
MMKQKLIATILFMFIVVMGGCSSNDEKPETSNGNESLTYDLAAFDISLRDTSGNLISVSPDGKTIYAYFTGVSWQICINQLVELNKYSETELKGVKMYAISYSTPEEHSLIKETFNLDSFEFLSDLELEFGERFGFFDVEENNLYRGYVGVNPETENIVSEVDYLVGDNIKVVLKVMEEL